MLHSRGFESKKERKKAEEMVKSDLSKLRDKLAEYSDPNLVKYTPSADTVKLAKDVAKLDAPKCPRKQSKCLVNQYTPQSDDYIGWESAGLQGGAALHAKLQDHTARVVTTQFNLKEYFDKEYQLPKLDIPADTAAFQSVTFLGQEDTIHLVNSNGLHYASIIKKPDSAEFDTMYNEFRKLQADLPKSAGAPVEALCGNFFTFHLMLSGQDTAHMDHPYFNQAFVKNYRKMIKFLWNKHIKALWEYCNTKFFKCFPQHTAHYMHIGASKHYHPHGAFLWAPCFPSLAINQEGKVYSLPHRDWRDYLQGLAGVFSFGDYTELNISFAEAKVSLDFPPGALCFFPSHVLHHFNSPILEGETRGSMTMFMSTNVPKWVGYDGKASDASEEVKQGYREHCLCAWQLFQPLSQ